MPIPQMRKQRIVRVKNLLKVRQLHENSGVIKLERFALTDQSWLPHSVRRQTRGVGAEQDQGSHTPCLRGMRCWGVPVSADPSASSLQQTVEDTSATPSRSSIYI